MYKKWWIWTTFVFLVIIVLYSVHMYSPLPIAVHWTHRYVQPTSLTTKQTTTRATMQKTTQRTTTTRATMQKTTRTTTIRATMQKTTQTTTTQASAQAMSSNQ